MATAPSLSGEMRRRLLAEVLNWHVEAGVDIAVEEHAPDRFAVEDFSAPVSPAPPVASHAGASAAAPPPIARPKPAPAPDEATHAARALAQSAPDLATLERLLAGFDGCALKATAQRLVFADGNPGAPVMLIGEAPGRDEDEIGRPFVGRSGQLLDKMLAAIGLDRSGVYIANVIPWRPPGNRTPSPQETAICLPFIRRQIELSGARLLVTLGAPATQALTGQTDGILRLRGRWLSMETARGALPCLPTLHPAYLLRQPAQKRLAWRDLQALRLRLAEGPGAHRQP